MTVKPAAVIFTLLISLAAPSFSADEKPDLRDVRWGMTKDEVKKHENAEIIKDGEGILIYKIKGGTRHETIQTQPGLQVEGQRPAVIQMDIDVPDYDLVYLFPDGKLGMAVLHMNNPKADADDYIDELDRRADEIIEETGKEPGGQAKYGENETEDAPFEHPEGICTGRYGIRYIWPSIGDRTNIMVELDDKKPAPDKPECNLSIFYESVKYPIDPASSAKLHEAL